MRSSVDMFLSMVFCFFRASALMGKLLSLLVFIAVSFFTVSLITVTDALQDLVRTTESKKKSTSLASLYFEQAKATQ